MSPGLHFKEAMGAPVTNDAYILEWRQIGNDDRRRFIRARELASAY